jgi:hypothetical protein
MDFWKTYLRKAGSPEFGTKQLWLKTGERWNTSILRYLEFSSLLETGKSIYVQWSPDCRYIIAKDIISDLFVSFYDVNSRTVLAARLSGGTENLTKEISKAKKQMANPNIEMRVIGLQNSDKALAEAIGVMHNAVGTGVLAEVDLFGNQKRHIIMDLYTGRVYNLLLENRIYRPGELIVSQPQAPPGVLQQSLPSTKNQPAVSTTAKPT